MAEKKHPNILIFMVDEMQGQALDDDCQAITPNLDKLKKEGLCFTRAFTPSPHCCQPMISAAVAKKSTVLTIPLYSLLAFTLAGQRTMNGTR